MTAGERPNRRRLTMFAFADFAFNLYWQSVMMFLLFYYTDTLGFGIGLAATTYMIASIWDGVISFIIGVAADRTGIGRDYRRILTWGAVPLGLSFVLMYLPLASGSNVNIVVLLGAHLLFRTCYAAVNVPYLAMSARISTDPSDRSFVSGLRMIFGTVAAIAVSLLTVRLGTMLVGPANAFIGSAAVFALVATAALVAVGRSYRDTVGLQPVQPQPLGPIFRALAANRAFVMLSLAMMAMIVAVTMVGKSVLYYFKYFIHDEAAGQLALAQMMATGLVAVPLWMLLARRTGVRFVWIVSVTLCIALLAVFALVDLLQAGAMQAFLVAFHASVMGLNFALWALLPETVDYGEATSGRRIEATVFGISALLQRISIGVATGVLGWGFTSAGFRPNTALGADTLADIRGMLSLWPILLFALSAVAISLAPGLSRAGDGKRRLSAAPAPVDP